MHVLKAVKGVTKTDILCAIIIEIIDIECVLVSFLR